MQDEKIRNTDWSDPDQILDLFRRIPSDLKLIKHPDFLLKQIPPGIYELPFFSFKERREKIGRLTEFTAGMLEALVDCEFALIHHLVTQENKTRPDYNTVGFFNNFRIISFLESVPEEIRSRAISTFNMRRAETRKEQTTIVVKENKPVVIFSYSQPAAA